MLTIRKKQSEYHRQWEHQKNLPCLQPRKRRELNMNANAKLNTGELVCFTLGFSHFLRSRSLPWFSCLSPLEYAFTVLHV